MTRRASLLAASILLLCACDEPRPAPAAARTAAVTTVTRRPARFAPDEILIRLRPQAHPRPGRRQIGIASLDRLAAQVGVISVEQLARPGTRSDASHRLFAWYRILLRLSPGSPTGPIVDDDSEAAAHLREVLARYRAQPDVEVAERSYRAHADSDDPYFDSSGSWGQPYPDLWGLHTIDVEGAWSVTTGSPSIVVADVDTGVDRDHEDLAGATWTNAAELPGNGLDDDGNGYIDDVLGWDWVNGDNDPMDDHGHGSHTAGTIAATGDNGLGVVGVAQGTRIMALKFLDLDADGTLVNAIKALQYATDMGARVTSNSWSCGCYQVALDDAIDYAQARGVVTVAAAGNESVDALDSFPAAADRAIAVAATDPDDQRALFSNLGEKIDVAAPGVEVLSLKAAVSPMCTPSRTVGTSYCFVSGTSMAAPHVSGLAALLLARDPTLGSEQVRQALRLGAVDLGPPGKDPDTGYGRISASGSLAIPPPALAPILTSPRSRTVVATGLVDIHGEVAGSGLAGYTLEVGAGRAPATWTTFAAVATSVASGKLGTLDTRTLPDGPCLVRLTATGADGRSYQAQVNDLIVDNIDVAIEFPSGEVARAGTLPVIGTAATRNGVPLAGYRLEWANSSEVWTTTGITLAGAGSQPVTHGVLGSLDLGAIASSSSVSLRLTVTTASGAEVQTSRGLVPNVEVVAGWPRPVDVGLGCARCTLPSPVFVDLDGDGVREVVTPDGPDRIAAYRRDGGAVPGYPVALPLPAGATAPHFRAPVNVADLDGDGRPELLVAHRFLDAGGAFGSRLHVLTAGGAPRAGWPAPALAGGSEESEPTPTAADLDGDGALELLAAAGPVVHVYRLDGSELPGFPVTVAGAAAFLFAPQVLDLDGDDVPELVIATRTAQYVLDRRGRVRPGWPRPLPADYWVTGPAGLADGDGDGQPEVYVVATDSQMVSGRTPSQLFAWRADGTPLAAFPVALTGYGQLGVVTGTPSTVDITGDGRDEVALTTASFLFRLYDAAGLKLAGVPIYSGSSSSAVGDLNGDGIPDFLFPTAGKLQGVNGGSGANVWIKSLSPGFFTPVVLADLDGNGRLEVGAVKSDGFPQGTVPLYLWEVATSRPLAGIEWPQYLHDAAHSGRARARTVPPPPPYDTTPPTVAITSPAAGASVTGAIVASGTADDDVGLARVDLQVDGGAWLPATGTTSWSAPLDTAPLAAGAHQLAARATDLWGHEATAAIPFTVVKPGPIVTITSPAAGSVVKGKVAVRATASGPAPITSMTLRIDAKQVASSTSGSLSATWNTQAGNVAAGPHTLRVTATDQTGRSAEAQITVTVQK